MTGDLINPSVTFESKKELYAHLKTQVKSLVDIPNSKIVPQANTTTALANVSALLFYELNRYARPEATLHNLPINWLGFYLRQSPQLLALGPFQGRPACTVIPFGHGVCGTAAQKGESFRIADVHDFPGHIACDSVSNSEIVIPIFSPGGQVVAIIDADSMFLDFFEEEDQIGLECIASILADHLEFPMSRIFATNPLLEKVPFPHSNAFAAAAAAAAETTSGAVSGLEARPVPLPETSHIVAVTLDHALNTTVTDVEDKRSAPLVEPRHWKAEIGGWEFAATEFTRILTQEEVRQYEEELHILAIPEIQFAFNTLTIRPCAEKGTPLISFRLYDVLKSAAGFYQTAAYKDSVAEQVSIPVAESWKNAPYKVFDTKVDWVWRNNYFGVDVSRCALEPLEPSVPGINWDLLKDQTQPILFFHNFDMMEDDIHDHGVVSSSVRIRAMSNAFFILFRHFIRIERHQVWMRDVRIFHEYNVKLPDGQPHIVLREETRSLNIDDNEKWHEFGPDEFSREAELIDAHDYYLRITNPADRAWWATIGTSHNSGT